MYVVQQEATELPNVVGGMCMCVHMSMHVCFTSWLWSHSHYALTAHTQRKIPLHYYFACLRSEPWHGKEILG